MESAALRHLFLSERLAQKVPGVDEKPMPLKKIGILGAGLSLWPILFKTVKMPCRDLRKKVGKILFLRSEGV